MRLDITKETWHSQQPKQRFMLEASQQWSQDLEEVLEGHGVGAESSWSLIPWVH